MNIHAISKAVVLYFVMLFTAMSILIFNKFTVTEYSFTIFLLIGVFVLGFYTGKNSRENAGLNGFLIGLLTSVLLIFFISMYADMKWELNFMIMVVWISVSVVGAIIGGRISSFFYNMNKKLENAKKTAE